VQEVVANGVCAHGERVHLAGVVADGLGADVEGQTRDVLRRVRIEIVATPGR
jgi:hypothetical protein